ncbi:MAG: hypothetical protein JWP71_1885 [Mucilaginibacter sp.]|nr:hypothetical protein [Mucilaginibacter sp.]
MILCQFTAEDTSAIISGLALLGTIYTLFSTRKDADKIQKQVDSLASMAKIYQTSRHDEIMPNFVIDDYVFTYTRNYIQFRNDSKSKAAAYEFIVLKAEFINIHKFETFEPPKNIEWNTDSKLHFTMNDVLLEKLQGGYVFFAEVQFYNKDKERFTQKIEKNIHNHKTSYPPEYHFK